MDAAANNVNERNMEPTRMDDIKPKTIAVLKEMFMRDENPNADDSKVNRFLRLIRETGSVIAGGFLLHALHDEDQHNNYVQPWSRRYNEMNHPDIDIYVPMENAYQFMQQLVYGSAVIEPILGEYYPIIGSFKATMYCQSFLRRNGIQTIHNIYIEQDGDGRRANHNFEMDIMIVRSNRTPIQVANNFDLTFCQIWFDGENVYASHPEDVRNKSGILQGDYVNLFVQGNEFLQKRLKKYQGRGYEIRLDPVRMEEIAGNALSTMPICREEPREAILNHWTSRVILYWLLGVRDNFVAHDKPLTPSLSHDAVMAVPLLLHEKSLVKGTSGDYFIPAHRNRDLYNKDNYPQDLNGYDSEDYANDESLYPILGHHYDQDWDADQHKLEYFREANKLIEMIMWPNEYRIPLPGGRRYVNHETMGAIFDYAHDDQRKEHYRPFYDALRARCIRKSKYTAITAPPPNNPDDNEDNDDDEDKEEVFDLHQHPLNVGISAADLEGYLGNSFMTASDAEKRQGVRCYHLPDPENLDNPVNCRRLITMSEVKMIVSNEFYEQYSRPAPVRMGLDQFIDFFDQFLGNEKELNSQFGEIFHHTLCPFCIQFESRDSGCAYMTHSARSGMALEPHCKEEVQVRELFERYQQAGQQLLDEEYEGQGPPPHMEFCAECGRPCANHKHLTLDGTAFEVAPQVDGHDDYGKCAGGGRAELFARVLAIRQVYRENNGLTRMEERRRAALAADAAPRNAALMARAHEIVAMAPAERVWGNANLPRNKQYNDANGANGANAENDTTRRRRRIRERYDALLVRVNRIAEYQPIDRQELREKEGIVELHDEVRDAMGNLEEGNLEIIVGMEVDIDRLEEDINDFFRMFIFNNNEAQNAPQNNVEQRRQTLIEGYAWLQQRLNDIMDEEMAPLAQPILDALEAIHIIAEPEFAQVQNLEHYEQEMDRIQEMVNELEGRNNHEEIFNGGRFNRSRKKKLRRKQKTFRKLLKKLK